MAEDSGQTRSEAATPRRREEARKQGHVPISTELVSSLVTIAGIATIWLGGETAACHVQTLTRGQLLTIGHLEWTVDDTTKLFGLVMRIVASTAGLLVLASLVVGFAANVLQIGFQINSESLQFKWNRLSPGSGWEKLGSTKSVVRTILMILKAVGISIVAMWIVRSRMPQAIPPRLDAAVTIGWRFNLLIALAAAGFMLVTSTIDYAFQRWRHEQDLKMTRRELRDEHRQEEGDPHVKNKLRKLAREASKYRMLRNVAKASVVLTNPTHIAVALQYERGLSHAPVVVAKGEGLTARRITRMAKEHGIPILERKPLARALYAAVPVDQEIPPSLYHAIAEILAYIYKSRQ